MILYNNLKRFYSIGKFADRLPYTLGQALNETRPNLIKPGDITAGITAQEYYLRRLKLLDKLPAKSCVILPSNITRYASGSVFYKFQQNTDFYYLSGFDEPNSLIILEKPNDNLEESLFHMLVQEKDPFKEKWEGARTGTENSYNFFNADEVYDIKNWKPYLEKILKSSEKVFFNIDYSFSTFANDEIAKVINDSGKTFLNYKRIISENRLIKSEDEIAIIRKCGQISGRSYNEAMAAKIQSEKNLQAFLEYKFISNGLDSSGYIPVVAGGPNALTIHYTINNDIIRDDEMVLIDAGGKFGNYTADISRTFPIMGKFSEPQRELYEAVLDAQRECIKVCSQVVSGGVSFADLHNFSRELLYRNLQQLGGFKDLEKNIDVLYPHHIGHYLGLDLHDVPSISMKEALKENSVITIEPGIYCPADDSFVPKHYQNIGIRIEDNVALLADGNYSNLTVEAVKEVVDIENVIANGTNRSMSESFLKPLI
ncbi:hypothetical protein QEN19_001318 [Hanseniaspora menglaensis]